MCKEEANLNFHPPTCLANGGTVHYGGTGACRIAEGAATRHCDPTERAKTSKWIDAREKRLLALF